MRLSVVVPALDEEAAIGATLARLAPLRAAGHQVVVADGGSGDRTVEIARPLADAVLVAGRGRARQMNAGAAAARGEVLLFLHADTLLPETAADDVLDGLRASGRRWGRFDARLSGAHPLLRIVERMMNARSRLTGIATGDQALFVERALFAEMGGFPDIPLMEDVALSKRLKRAGPPLCLRTRVVTSSRRWEERGVLRTIGLMWGLRAAYAAGVSPERLARLYR
ncbi:MAG: TIGR04283 family arsenosugar biosynthesis glycosyltransferase [Pseudomonadota bacterium]